RLVHLGFDVDVADADLARLGIDHEAEGDGHEAAGLDRHHRVAAALEQEAHGPVAEAAAVRDVVRARRRAAQLVAEILGGDRHVDAAALEARADAVLQHVADIELGQPYVAVGVALDVAEGGEIELLAEPLGEDGYAVLAALDAPLDDGALEGVGDALERDAWLRKLLGDHGERGRRRAADAERQ